MTLTNSLPRRNVKGAHRLDHVQLQNVRVPFVWKRVEAQFPTTRARSIATTPGTRWAAKSVAVWMYGLERFEGRNTLQRHDYRAQFRMARGWKVAIQRE